MPPVLNMPIFWIWWSSEYGRVLNMPALHSVLNMPKCLDRVLNTSWVLNMPEFWIWQGSEYLRVAQGSKYATIWLNSLSRTWISLNISELTIIDRVLNMYHTIHSARSTNYEYLLRECFGKIIIDFSYFWKTFRLKFFWGFWLCAGF